MTGGTLQATGTFALDNGGLNMRNVALYGGGGTFDVTASNALTVSGVISNVNISNLGPLVKTGPGMLVLNGANTYTGATIIRGGVLSTASLANGNSTSGIGNSPSTAPALVLDGGTLQYTGAGVSTDRSFVLTTNGGGIDASGSGPLVFSTSSNVMLVPPPIVASGPLAGTGARAITLTGTNTNQNVFAGQIVDGTGGATSLVKNGAGWWTLTNNNTYSGSTTVNGGTLTLSAATNNNIASSTLINVGASGLLDLSGLNSSTLVLAGGQTITGPGLVSGSITASALAGIQPGTVASGLAGTGASNISGGLALLGNSSLNFGLNGSNGTANTINVGGTLTLPGSGTAVSVALYSPNGAVPFTPGAGTTIYDLIQYGSLSGLLSELSVSNPNSAFSYSFGTTTVGGANYVDLSITQLAVAGVWATNGPGNWSNAANWTGGVPQNAGDSATFSSAITSSATVTLDQPETVGSVTFTNTASYVVSGTNTLTLSSTAGASIKSTLGSHTIAAPVNLAFNTAANVSNGATLTLSGPLGGAGALTFNGGGTLVLSGSNNYGPTAGTVGTTINAGLVQVGNSASFSTGDVSVAGNATIQAVANGLSLANNFIIAGSATATLDTQGNTLTVGGVISESAVSGSLSKNGSGTLILTASNSYSGATRINAGTLQLDTGGSNVYIAGPIVNNGTLVLDRGDMGLALPGVISGSGNLTQVSTGMSTLAGANTFTGPTVISAGTLMLANNLALQNSTLNYNNPNGTLSFGTLAAASVGGLTGSLSLALQNTNSAAVALTVGGNGQTTTYSGNFSGPGSLTWIGPGSFTLTGSNNIAGALQMSQNNGVAGGGNLILPTGSLTVSSIISYGSGGANLITVSGASLNVSGVSTFNAGNGASNGNGGLLVSSGLVNLTGGLNIATDNRTANSIVQITGGTVNSGTITIGRTGQNVGTLPTAGSTTQGLYVSGGVLNVTGSINVGNTNAATNSTVNFRMDGGTVSVSGPIGIGLNNGGRWSIVDVNGGSLVDTDTTSGITMDSYAQFGSQDEFLVRAGTASVQMITMGQGGIAGVGVVNLLGGNLYIGAQGIVVDPSGVFTATIDLASGTLGATAPWATTVPISLTGGSAAGATVQTADMFGSGNSISFSGAISGTGGMTITGTGGVTLNYAGNSYSGNTVINAGSLVAGAANTLSPYSTIVLNNGLLDPSVGPQSIAGLTLNGGSVNLNSAITLSTLTMSATGSYTLAAGASGSLTFNSGFGTAAVIAATGGSQSLIAPTTLTSNQTNISVTGSGGLNISDSLIDGTGGFSAVTFSSSDGSGLLVLSGSNNFSGGFTVLSGTAIVATPASLADGSNLNVGPDSTMLAPIIPFAIAPTSSAPASVPEPATIALLCLGLLSGGICLRVRARKILRSI